jgi:diguanylate cyclase (GGDEF)-like protein
MGTRQTRQIRVVSVQPEEQPFGREGRPKERRKPIAWMPVVLRLLTLAWAGAIVAALFDEFGSIPHLPFVTAMGMTGLLVAASFLWTAPDKTEQKELQEAADDLATDLLTDLPTFAHFSRRLGDEFARARRMGRNVAVVLIDVNNLTAVNKEYGVRAGDEVLRHVAKAVDSTRRYNDVVARLGDDEFGVLLLDTGEEGVKAFIDRLEDRLARESAMADVDGRSVSLWAGVCSGSAVSSPAMAKADMVLDDAMTSLNQAKQDRERRRRMWLSA